MAISSAVDASAVARVTGIKTQFKDLRRGGILLLPQRIMIVGQGASSTTYSTDKIQLSNAADVGARFGYGSPLHLASKELFPVNGDGVGTLPVTFYPLEDDVSGVAATGDITPSGAVTKAGAFVVKISEIRSLNFAVEVGDTVADIVTKITTAINGELDAPMVAVDNTTDVGLTAKWAGSTGNDLFIAIEGPDDTGVSFAVTQPAGGLNSPAVTDALAQVGDVWETMCLNCLGINNSVTLDEYQTFGEGRWGALVRKPLVVFTGNTATDVNTAVTVPDGRKTDRINAQLVAPGSNNLPFVVAARQLARIAVLANNNPPHDYGSQDATGLVPGADGDQWTYPERDQAVKAGSSTVEVKDGVVNISDVVTFFHPTGDPTPAYRFVVDIVKLQNVIFNLDLIFNTKEWDGAPLIPDDQPTVNPDAKKPKTAVAAVGSMLDSLGLNAIISDPETAKASTFAEIDSGNPKRLNVTTTVQLSGNTNIKSIDLNFGFFFGTSQIVA